MSSTGYRQAHRTCPNCAVPLDEQLHDGVHVDVCPDCSGVWIDWMDGDLEGVTSKLELPRAQLQRGEGTGACPVCASELDEDAFDGVTIRRCGSCAGAWISRRSLAAFQQRIADDTVNPTEDPLLTRVLDAIGRFILPG